MWQLTDALRQASTTTEPTSRAALLRQAIDAHTGPLAQGHDYDWIEPPREQLRRHGIRARLSLAQLITADAINVFDLDQIALRLANGADYDGLTALIANCGAVKPNSPWPSARTNATSAA
ncbi:hypothetical protein [Dactylosporangium sp. CA-139066]|uniref:hypothetical protein n=1 Tax=Dactylosporangium sp. CA-139066 TaxID=3239930 RepID=UPI003D8CF075